MHHIEAHLMKVVRTFGRDVSKHTRYVSLGARRTPSRVSRQHFSQSGYSVLPLLLVRPFLFFSGHSQLSPSMLRDPHNKPLPTGLFIPFSQGQIPYDDSVLYR